MGDKSRGLYPEGKFIVRRRDGTDETGGKHDGCNYFVLDITHDPHAIPAIRSYAASARKDGYGLLAEDLEGIAATTSPPSETAEAQKCVKCGHEGLQRTDSGFCLAYTPKDKDDNTCGCKCEFPAPVPATVDDEGDANRLAFAIESAAVKAGIITGGQALSGPQLLMLCDDLANAALRSGKES